MTTEAVEQTTVQEEKPAEETPAAGSGTESDSEDSVPDLEEHDAAAQAAHNQVLNL